MSVHNNIGTTLRSTFQDTQSDLDMQGKHGSTRAASKFQRVIIQVESIVAFPIIQLFHATLFNNTITMVILSQH